VVDLLSALDGEDDRPITMAALLLTLAFRRVVGSAGMVEGGLVFNGE
jgi:hypothetical protein